MRDGLPAYSSGECKGARRKQEGAPMRSRFARHNCLFFVKRVLSSLALVAGIFTMAGCVSVRPPPEGGTTPLPAHFENSGVATNVSVSVTPAETLINKQFQTWKESGTDELKVPASQLITTPVEVVTWVPTQVDRGIQKLCNHLGPFKVICHPIHEVVTVPTKVTNLVEKTVTAKIPTTIAAQHDVFFDTASLNASGPTITATATLNYDVKLTAGPKILTVGLASCGESDPKPDIIVTDTVTPQWGQDGNITLNGGVPQARFDRPCQLTFADINLSDVLRISGLQHKIDDLITSKGSLVPQSFNLNPILDKGWNEIQQPIKISDNLWLLINPTSIDLTAPTGTGKVLQFQGALGAQPALVYSAEAPKAATVARPALGHAPTGNVFTLEAEGRANYYDVNALLDSPAIHKKIDDQAGHTRVPFFGKLAIKKIWIYPSHDKIAVVVVVSRPVIGTLYLIGEPRYDAGKDAFWVDHVDFSADTKNALVSWGSWLLHSPLRQLLADEINNDLKQIQDKGRPKLSALEASLRDKEGEKNNVKYVIHLTAVQPENVYVSDYSIVARVLLSGDAAVSINGIPKLH